MTPKKNTEVMRRSSADEADQICREAVHYISNLCEEKSSGGEKVARKLNFYW